MAGLSGVTDFATRDIGPLPVWGWGIAGVGGVILGRRISSAFGGGGDTAASGPGAAILGTGGTVGPGSVGGGAYGLPNSAVAASGESGPSNNNEWRAAALRALQGAGYGSLVSDQALGTYLAGRTLTSDQQAIIDAALSAIGLPPSPPPVAPQADLPAEQPTTTVTTPTVPTVEPQPVTLSDPYTEIVRSAYLDVLGRAPDAAGLAYWVGELRGGMSVGELRSAIAYSPESVNLTTPIAPPAGQDPAALGSGTPAPVATIPVAVAAQPNPVPVQQPVTPAAVRYTVRSGDTLSKIGRQYGVSATAIYAANRSTIGGNPNLIKPGQVLTIPK